MKLFSLLIAILLSPAIIFGQQKSVDLATRLQTNSVTLHARGSQGSGVLITRDNLNFVLTAAHVVEDCRQVLTLSDNKSGSKKLVTKFEPVKIIKELYVNGKSVGITSVDADVLAYSSADFGHDLALLKLRYKITDDSVVFYSEKEIPSAGVELIHVGSLLGQDGSNSYVRGVVSQIGRVLFDRVFDQTDVAGFPGSSGGGLFLASDGRYMGCLVRGAAAGFILYVPQRRIKEWADEHNVAFIFNPSSKPNLKEIKLEGLEPIEDEKSSVHQFKLFPTLLERKKE